MRDLAAAVSAGGVAASVPVPCNTKSARAGERVAIVRTRTPQTLQTRIETAPPLDGTVPAGGANDAGPLASEFREPFAPTSQQTRRMFYSHIQPCDAPNLDTPGLRMPKRRKSAPARGNAEHQLRLAFGRNFRDIRRAKGKTQAQV